MALKKEDIKAVLELQAAEEEGYELADAATTEAFEYFELLLQNSGDKNYQLMTAKKLAFEVGISHALEHAYEVHTEMKHTLSKKKMMGSKEHAAMYAHLFLARALQNVFNAVEKRNNEPTE